MSDAASGLLVVDKPAGMTSHDVVARVRRVAGTRKVGHAGTLDPMATGVLLLGVNKGTRLLGHLVGADKTYRATARLGAATTTDDAEGEVTATAEAHVLAALGEPEVRSALSRFTGPLQQVPSSVSAVKVRGRRAYDLVRAGEPVQLAARSVTVHELAVLDVTREDGFVDVRFSVRCSSGTYVRALARDLGAALGVGGHLTALRRVAVGPMSLDDATALADLEGAGPVPLLPLGEAARRFLPAWTVDDETARAVGFGRALDVGEERRVELPDHGPVALLGTDGGLLAVYERAGDRLEPRAVLV